MARISEIAIKQQPAHYMLTIRKTINFMKEYSVFAGQALAETESYMKELGIAPISGPVTCFHNTDLEKLDVETGWQITRQVEDKGTVCCTPVPARRVVTAIDQGPYEQQDPTLTDIFAWAATNGVQPLGPILYCYLNEVDRPPAEYLTQMMLPIRDD